MLEGRIFKELGGECEVFSVQFSAKKNGKLSFVLNTEHFELFLAWLFLSDRFCARVR